MRDSVSTFIAAAGTAIYHDCDEKFQQLPVFMQAVLRQQRKAALFVFGKVIDATESLTPIKDHGAEALTALPKFLSYCVTDPKAPRIYFISKRLIVDDFLPVFLAVYFYHLAQYLYQSTKESMPESLQSLLEKLSLVFTAALLMFSFLRKLQFQVRAAVLSFEFPRAFHGMPNTFAIDNDACRPCNALRFITGDMRSVMLYQSRLLSLALLGSSIEYLGLPIVSWFLTAYQVSISGQMIAEYRYASANVCERHRWESYKEYFNLFITLGLLHQVGTFGLAFGMSQLTQFVHWQFERLFGNVLLLTPMLQVLADLPKETYGTFLGGILMFYLIGLTYYMPFPRAVCASKSWSMDFLRFANEIFMDGVISKMKKSLKLEGESKGHSLVRERFESTRNWVCWSNEKIHSIPGVMPFLRHTYTRELMSFMLPSMLRTRTAALTDPVFVLYTPRMFAEIKNILTSISSFRPIVLNVMGMGKELNSIFSRSSVKWTLTGLSFFIPQGGFVLPAVGEMLTVDFIMNKVPKHLSDLRSICEWFHEKKLIWGESYDTYIKKLEEYEKDINLLKKVLNELPKAVIEDFLAWIGTEECRAWIAKSMITLNALNDQLARANEERLKQLGFDSISYGQVESFEYDVPTEETVRCLEAAPVSCMWPSSMATAALLRASQESVDTSVEDSVLRAAVTLLVKPKDPEVWDDCDTVEVAADSDDDSVVVSTHRLDETEAVRSVSQQSVRTAAEAGKPWSAGVFRARESHAAVQPFSQTARNFSVVPTF